MDNEIAKLIIHSIYENVNKMQTTQKSTSKRKAIGPHQKYHLGTVGNINYSGGGGGGGLKSNLLVTSLPL